ncbi:MAG: sodium:solute symporter, partial [Flavobacteriales bacterium]
DSQRNMITFSAVMLVVVALFLILGGMLYVYMQTLGLPAPYVGDDIFPKLVMQHMPPMMGLLFIIGLVSALFPSADGAITALTASFCIDLLRIQHGGKTEEEQSRIRKRVHLAFTGLFLAIVLFFKWLNQKTIVDVLMDVAGYTYGPLLGLFAFGILTQRSLKNRGAAVIAVCLLAPALTYTIAFFSKTWLGGYEMGVENLPLNGLLTCCGLFLISKKED